VVSEKQKSLTARRGFFSFSTYIQNTKWSVKTCQISWGIVAWKSIVLLGHYFGFRARLLTRNEDKAKGGEKQRVSQLAG
jgi:hypothetical protein